MNYTFIVETVRPEDGVLRVLYSTEGLGDRRAFVKIPLETIQSNDEVEIRRLIIMRAPVREWNEELILNNNSLDESLNLWIDTPQIPGTTEEFEQSFITDDSYTPLEGDELLIYEMTMNIQNHLDAVAQSRQYDSIISLCTYATTTLEGKYKTEGEAGVEWRTAVWLYAEQALADIQAGTRSVPTKEELIAELPIINW